MSLIEPTKGWILNTDGIVDAIFDEGARSLKIFCEDRVRHFVDDEADRVLALLRQQVAPRPGAMREVFGVLEDFHRRLDDLERTMEKLAGRQAEWHAKAADRIEAIARRLADVEAEAFEGAADRADIVDHEVDGDGPVS
jgi:hypothetical protein